MGVIETGAIIEPFLDRVSEIPLFGDTIRGHLAAEITASGLESDRVTVADHAIVTAEMLRQLAAPGRGPARLAVEPSSALGAFTAGRSERPSGGPLCFDVFLDAPSGAGLEELRRTCPPRVVAGPARTHRRELARFGPGPHHLILPDDRAIAGHVEHWMHLLWLVPALLPALLARRPRTWFRRGDIHRSSIARSAKVHPTAYVEDSIIEEEAVIGAGCSIRGSYIGARSRIGDFTKVVRSCLGEQTHTLADGTFMYVVSLGEGTLTNLLIRDVLIGRRVFLTTGVIFWADALGADIEVEHRGTRISSERPVLGGAVGHGSVLGARTIVAAGVALPNRTTVVMRKDEGVTRVEASPSGTPMCWDEARLVPYAKLRPGVVPDEIATAQEDARNRP